jgi:hypothetical protein
MNRACSTCGKWYYRVNAIRSWDKQNPGHRAGWHRSELKLCTTCMPVQASQRLLMLASTTLITKGPRRALAPVRDIRESRVQSIRKRAS